MTKRSSRRQPPEEAPLEWARAPWAREALGLWSRRFHGRLNCLDISGNATYLVRTETERFALRIYRPGRWSGENILYEHELLEYLGAPLNVSAPYRGRDRETLQELSNGLFAAIFPWIHGRAVPVRPSARAIERVGTYLGRLHARAASFRCRWPRIRWDRPELLTRTHRVIREEWPRQFPGEPLPDLGPMVERAQDLWRRLSPRPGVLHGDPHWGNFKVAKDRVLPFDFDDAGPGCFAYDLAILHFATTEEGSDLHPTFALLRGYHSTAPWKVTAREIWLFVWTRVFYLIRWALERSELFGREEMLRMLRNDFERLRGLEKHLKPS